MEAVELIIFVGRAQDVGRRSSTETARHQALSCTIGATSTEHDSPRINGNRCVNSLLNGRNRRVTTPARSSQAATIKQQIRVGVESCAGFHGIRSGAGLGDLLVVTVANKGPHCGPMLRSVSGNRPSSGSGQHRAANRDHPTQT